MKQLHRFNLLASLLALPLLSVSAQNDNRRWAVEASIGPTFINVKTQIKDMFGVDNGVSTYFGAEYYIPESHFSARLGYKKEELNLIGQEVQATYNQISLGGRWYPGNEEWMIQPYVGANANITIASDNATRSSGYISGTTFDYESIIKSPAVTITPTVGFDLYMLSSVAFTVNYTYEVGTGSKYEIYNRLKPSTPLIAKGNLNHGTLNFGVKITFPFRFTSDDGRYLLSSILTSLIPSPVEQRLFMGR